MNEKSSGIGLKSQLDIEMSVNSSENLQCDWWNWLITNALMDDIKRELGCKDGDDCEKLMVLWEELVSTNLWQDCRNSDVRRALKEPPDEGHECGTEEYQWDSRRKKIRDSQRIRI